MNTPNDIIPLGVDYFQRADIAELEHRATAAGHTPSEYLRILLDHEGERQAGIEQDEALARAQDAARVMGGEDRLEIGLEGE